jgi:hypothetical protein
MNLDTSTALAFVAEGSSIRHQLKAIVTGKTMVMTGTAEHEFVQIVSASGGPLEQARALRFLSRVQVIPDAPSPRAQALTPTKQLQANDIIILGTGDARGIITLTADRRAVSAARSQGVDFAVSLHPPVPLRGA